MKKLNLLVALFSVLSIYGCTSRDISHDDKFHGMWRLDKFERRDSLTGSWADDPIYAGSMGYILYDGRGHMGVHLLFSKDYKKFNTSVNLDSLNADELKRLVRFYQSNFVYFADYTTTDSTIEHRRLTATEPQNWGTTLTRSFEFRGDTLILTAKEAIGGQQVRLRWIKE